MCVCIEGQQQPSGRKQKRADDNKKSAVACRIWRPVPAYVCGKLGIELIEELRVKLRGKPEKVDG